MPTTQTFQKCIKFSSRYHFNQDPPDTEKRALHRWYFINVNEHRWKWLRHITFVMHIPVRKIVLEVNVLKPDLEEHIIHNPLYPSGNTIIINRNYFRSRTHTQYTWIIASFFPYFASMHMLASFLKHSQHVHVHITFSYLHFPITYRIESTIGIELSKQTSVREKDNLFAEFHETTKFKIKIISLPFSVWDVHRLEC